MAELLATGLRPDQCTTDDGRTALLLAAYKVGYALLTINTCLPPHMKERFGMPPPPLPAPACMHAYAAAAPAAVPAAPAAAAADVASTAASRPPRALSHSPFVVPCTQGHAPVVSQLLSACANPRSPEEQGNEVCRSKGSSALGRLRVFASGPALLATPDCSMPPLTFLEPPLHLLAACPAPAGRASARLPLLRSHHTSHSLPACPSLRPTQPLYFAAVSGNVEVARLLLDGGAEVDAVSDRGRQGACHMAAQEGQTSFLELLLNNGASPSTPDAFGQTPLIHAATHGRTGTVRVLLQRGAAVNTHGRRLNETALDRAAGAGAVEACRLLLQAGANPNGSGTGLPRAAAFGHSEVVRLLLGAGADPTSMGPSGTALHTASASGHLDIVQLLLGHPGVDA